MKKKDLKEKTREELLVEKDKLVKEYSDMKFKRVTGVLENPLKLRTVKKSIARINTIVHKMELNRMKKELEKMENKK
jgi:large subunit ribosomal protein L29